MKSSQPEAHTLRVTIGIYFPAARLKTVADPFLQDTLNLKELRPFLILS
ncbi:MAG TPA: hypothetical protein VM260_22650 [Pirellula sp.]|nr:hypothetical protein [Pirellula sp.]